MNVFYLLVDTAQNSDDADCPAGDLMQDHVGGGMEREGGGKLILIYYLNWIKVHY